MLVVAMFPLCSASIGLHRSLVWRFGTWKGRGAIKVNAQKVVTVLTV